MNLEKGTQENKGGYHMPAIHVNLLQGQSIEAKRKFASDLTKLARENLSLAGILVADREK